MPADQLMEADALPHPLVRRLRFSWLLPLGQLLLCAALLWPVRLMIFRGLGIPLPHLVEQTMLPDYFRWGAKKQFLFSSVMALNLPGGIVQLPYVISNPTKREWMPAGIDFAVWRVVTWPWICLPFWWIAGRAIDALTSFKRGCPMPRIGWPETVAGAVWLVGGMTLFIGFLFSSIADKNSDFIGFAAAGGLWALLGALSVIARFRQWRWRRQLASG